MYNPCHLVQRSRQRVAPSIVLMGVASHGPKENPKINNAPYLLSCQSYGVAVLFWVLLRWQGQPRPVQWTYVNVNANPQPRLHCTHSNTAPTLCDLRRPWQVALRRSIPPGRSHLAPHSRRSRERALCDISASWRRDRTAPCRLFLRSRPVFRSCRAIGRPELPLRPLRLFSCFRRPVHIVRNAIRDELSLCGSRLVLQRNLRSPRK
jgi:hypothetical protein